MPDNSYIQSFSIFIICLATAITFHNWKINKNVIYLSLFLIIFSISFESYNLLIFGGNVNLLAILLANFGPLYFLSGPLLYFFVRSITSDNSKLRKSDFWHFLPFTINLIAILPYMITSFEYKVGIASGTMQNFYEYKNYDFKLFYPHYINNIGRALQLIVYLAISISILIKSYKKIKPKTGPLKKQFKYVYFWLFVFILLVQIISFIHIAVGYLFATTNDLMLIRDLLFRLINIALIIYLIIPVFVLFNPKILYGMPVFKAKTEEENGVEKPTKTKNKVIEKPKEIIDENSIVFQLTEDIMNYLNNEKPYLKPDFSINDICIYFNKPQNHIYY